jgi:hypothetical protein
MAQTFVPERGPDGKILIAPTLTELLPAMPTEEPTDRPTPAALPTKRRDQIITYVALALVCLVVGTLAARITASPATPAPVAPVAAIAPTAAAIIQPTPAAVLDRAIVAYAAPDGDILGAVEAGRPYTAVGRWSNTWAQLDIGQRAPIWVRLGDLPGLTVAGLPDLAPKPTAIPVYSVPVAPVAPVVPVECTEANATYRASRRVEKNGMPIGEVASWSCVSQAAADAELERQAALLAR